MKITFLAVLCTATALSLIPAASALAQGQSRGGAPCAPNDRSCVSYNGPSTNARIASPGKRVDITPQRAPTHARPSAPRVGESGRHGQPFVRANNSRIDPPPRGHEYRVVDGNLVLLDQNTQRIVAVVGLLSALAR